MPFYSYIDLRFCRLCKQYDDQNKLVALSRRNYAHPDCVIAKHGDKAPNAVTFEFDRKVIIARMAEKKAEKP